MLSTLFFLLLCAPLNGQIRGNPDTGYYPLSLGRAWTYVIKDLAPPAHTSTVTWKVTMEEPGSPIVYQVWPTPMQVDDEAFRLRVTEVGIQEVDTGAYIMKFPIATGAAWESRGKADRVRPGRTFRVVSTESDCVSGAGRHSGCAVIEDIDRRFNLRTVTTYARGVGPVKFDYYRKSGAREILIRTMELTGTRVVIR